jgi:hypothetical protein
VWGVVTCCGEQQAWVKQTHAAAAVAAGLSGPSPQQAAEARKPKRVMDEESDDEAEELARHRFVLTSAGSTREVCWMIMCIVTTVHLPHQTLHFQSVADI